MSKKYRFKNVIDKLEVTYCGPLYYAVPLVRDFLVENSHPKNRVLKREYCTGVSSSRQQRQINRFLI